MQSQSLIKPLGQKSLFDALPLLDFGGNLHDLGLFLLREVEHIQNYVHRVQNLLKFPVRTAIKREVLKGCPPINKL